MGNDGYCPVEANKPAMSTVNSLRAFQQFDIFCLPFVVVCQLSKRYGKWKKKIISKCLVQLTWQKPKLWTQPYLL